jgi:hypothetical protein
MDGRKHKFIANLNISLESVNMKIHEDLDCIEEVVNYEIILETNDSVIRIENYFQTKGNSEMKYYRNNELLKHTVNGKVVIDWTQKQGLVSVINIDENKNINNVLILALDYFKCNENLKSNETMPAIEENNQNDRNYLTQTNSPSDKKEVIVWILLKKSKKKLELLLVWD